MALKLLPTIRRAAKYDVTIFQTPMYGEKKGYKQVYRIELKGESHQDVINKVFRLFNVQDLIPEDYFARFISTGDILLIDEGKKGMTYYKLIPGGWEKINRMLIR